MPDDAGPPPRAGVSASSRFGRTVDRRLTFAGLAAAGGFIALALASLALPETTRLGTWLPLHLALAGGAATAIAALMPFFTAALAAAPPASPGVRASGVVLVASGALAAALGRAAGAPSVAANGGIAFLVGLTAVGFAVALPLRRALGVRRRPVEIAYGLALIEVALGVGLGTAYLGGVARVGDSWADLKPAHAWLNLFGFVGLVIAATLIHLAPTVSGTLIRRRRSGIWALAALASGPAAVALGYALQMDWLARAGAVVALGGSVGLALHGVAVWRGRGRWTSDLAWHRFAEFSLLAAPIWLCIGLLIATGRVLVDGADPAGWQLSVVLAPFVAGFVLQTIAGASTHLVPAIGPGDPMRHANQRRLLGTWALPRLVAWNAAVAALGIGLIAGGDVAPWSIVVRGSAGVLAGLLALSLALLVRAAAADRRAEPAKAAIPH